MCERVHLAVGEGSRGSGEFTEILLPSFHTVINSEQLKPIVNTKPT